MGREREREREREWRGTSSLENNAHSIIQDYGLLFQQLTDLSPKWWSTRPHDGPSVLNSIYLNASSTMEMGRLT